MRFSGYNAVDTLHDAEELLSGHTKVGTKVVRYSMSCFLHFCLQVVRSLWTFVMKGKLIYLEYVCGQRHTPTASSTNFCLCFQVW